VVNNGGLAKKSVVGRGDGRKAHALSGETHPPADGIASPRESNCATADR
jgi:hypothetical protein